MTAGARRRVAFLVNGTPSSAMGDRARAFASRIAGDFDVKLVHRGTDKRRAIGEMLRELRAFSPAVVYVFDVAYSGILAAAAWKLATRTPVVVDTGDAVVALAKAVGERGALAMLATRMLERLAVRLADHVVCRGTKHVPLLQAAGARGVTVVQDGVETAQFLHADGMAARDALGIPRDAFVVGVVGSVIWNARRQRTYGSELVALLAEVHDPRLRALLVGDGNGLAPLREQAATHGVAERLTLAGRQPYDRLPALLAAMDVCVSTQTNDLPGQVRTTGKLPIYLAAGRSILATDVGEASLVLPPHARIPFVGDDDPEYPHRLAERVRALMAAPELARADAAANRALAVERFEYDVLASRVATVLRDVLARRAHRSR